MEEGLGLDLMHACGQCGHVVEVRGYLWEGCRRLRDIQSKMGESIVEFLLGTTKMNVTKVSAVYGMGSLYTC